MKRWSFSAPFCIMVSDTCPYTSMVKATVACPKLFDRVLYPGSKSQYQNLYFVRGENTPLQTTLLGALRFMLLQKYGRRPDDFSELKPEHISCIGSNSFMPEPENGVQQFGKIHKLSPVFLQDQLGIHYIPVPMDHNLAADNTDVYTPFETYDPMNTADGDKLYTTDYADKTKATRDFILPGDDFKECFAIIKQMVPGCEYTPAVLLTSDDYDEEG